MALPSETFVQSLDPSAAKPVATTTFPTTDGSSAAVQWMLLTDARTPIGASVFSYATGNPQAVALVDPTGTHVTVQTGWVANTPAVTQAGGPWTVIASLAGAGAVTGSVGVTQLSSPWIVQGSVTATQGGAPWTAVVSVIGQPTVTASIAGPVPVTQSTSPWVVLAGSSGALQAVVGSVSVTGSVGALVAGSVQATVVGSVGATQAGAPWSVTGSQWVTGVVSVTQASSPWIVQVACTAGGGSTITGSVLATQGAAPWTVLASVSQVTSPWIVQVACTAGGGSAVTGSVYATQVGAPWSMIGSVGATQTGSWRVYVTGSDGTPIAVDSFSGGALLRVAVYSTPAGGSSPTSVFAIQQGSWQVNATVTGSVGATQLGAPWTVTGSVLATQGGAPWSVTGSTGATQLGAPWSVIGSQGVTQLGAPWTVTGSAVVQGQVASGTALAGNPLTLGAVAADYAQTSLTQVGCAQVALVLADRMGRLRVAVDTGNVAVVGSLQATQAGAPWIFTGSVGATQLGAPWTVNASVTGQLTATASVTGQVTVTASIAGNVPVTQVSSPWVIAGSVAATQAGAPWTFTGSVVVQGQVASGAVYAGNPVGGGALAFDTAQTSWTQVGCGQMTALVSDRQGRQRIAVDTGTLAVSQVSSPWVVYVASQTQNVPWNINLVDGVNSSFELTVRSSTNANPLVNFEIGVPTITNTWASVNSTAATIVPANTTRRRMILLNIAPVDVYVGAATVTTSVGMKLSPGASLTLHTTAALQAMTPQNSGFLAILEEYY